MSQTQETILLNKLQQQDAAEVLAWLKRIESGQELPVAGFNWLGLAELAAFEAHWKSNLLWAEVATSVYDRLAAENSSVRESLMISSMLVRAAAIAQHGLVSGHPVLDLQQIVRWFCDGLTISPHRAASKARHWRSCNIGEIRE
ncbi:MAG: hypothetical protein GDA43_01255 [Hormoscilla sp. SP5CHS1]|nr:hypothetical protein [Hormoscilla sp. SP12CHS1]MBC6451982.1 hypothetical protein [Hormoscilla sp. SP5CHS1]